MRYKLILLVMLVSCSSGRPYFEFQQSDDKSKWLERYNSFTQTYYFSDSAERMKSMYNEMNLLQQMNNHDSTHIYLDWDDRSLDGAVWGNPSREEESILRLELYSYKDSFRFGMNNLRVYSNSSNQIIPGKFIFGDSDTNTYTNIPEYSRDIRYKLFFKANSDTINTLRIEFDSLEINGRKRYVEPLQLKRIQTEYKYDRVLQTN